MKTEIKTFAESLQEDDVIGLFAVTIDIAKHDSITGKKAPFIRPAVTVIPGDGWSQEEQEKARKLLWEIADLFRHHFNEDKG